jgi:hypothetical protein
MTMPSDQHDTVVLGTDAPPANRHDTIVLNTDQSPAPAQQSSPTPPPAWQPAPPAPAPAAWQPQPSMPPYPYPVGYASGTTDPWGAPAGAPVIVMRNNAAVIGATLGSVTLFLSLIPLIGIVAWILAPIGLVTSGIGLLVGVSRRVGRAGALWGLVTSGAALLVCLAWTALLLAL